MTISGNLVRDPERIANDKGCKIAVAVNERIKKNDEWTDYANFIDVVAWGSLGEQVMKQLSKGSPVGIQGKLRQERWEKDGNKHSRVSVVAFAMFAPKGSNGNGGGGGYDEIPYQSQVPADTAGMGQALGSDEDIPFS